MSPAAGDRIKGGLIMTKDNGIAQRPSGETENPTSSKDELDCRIKYCRIKYATRRQATGNAIVATRHPADILAPDDFASGES